MMTLTSNGAGLTNGPYGVEPARQRREQRREHEGHDLDSKGGRAGLSTMMRPPRRGINRRPSREPSRLKRGEREGDNQERQIR